MAGTVGFAIPYRASSTYRAINLAAVIDHIQQHFPAAAMHIADTDHPRFNLAAARNAGVRHFTTCDTIVLCDADVLLDPDAVHEAIDTSQADSLIHVPYTRIQYLDRWSTGSYLEGIQANLTTTLDSTWSMGGAYVTTPAAWWAVGGQDERFTGWGYEDWAMVITHRTLRDPMPRHDGDALHLWHPTQPKQGDPAHDAGELVYGRYLLADGDEDAVRALMQERA